MMQVFDCEQGSEAWYLARLGIPTASNFGDLLAKGEGKTRRTLLLKLAGERLTGEPMENYGNAYMDRGKAMEAEARSLYAFTHAVEPTLVGFIRNGNAGASPDALLGGNGILEIKTAAPHLLIDRLTRDGFPPEHIAQCQGALWIAEREWIDIAIYWPKLPLFVRRAHRDEAYIRTLAAAVDSFNDELAHVVDRVSHYGEPPASVIRSQLADSLGGAA